MSWTVEYKADTKIIEGVFSDTMDGKQLRNAMSRRISLQHQYGADRVLVDASLLKQVGTTLDVFNLPDKQYPEASFPRSTKIALVMPTEDEPRKQAEFFINASLNRGWNTMAFDDRTSALKWLEVGVEPTAEA